jgi:YbbR domain-containing protein
MNLSTFRRLLLDNLTLKVISLVLAFLLWVQIAGQQRVQRSVAVSVEFINMPHELEITNDYPREVNVVISRPSSVRMEERQLAAVIDLSSAEPGTMVVPLTERNIRNVPSGVQIEGIEQRRIRLQLERIRRKTVRVVPETVGRPAEGFQIREVRSSPSEVLVVGPESRLDSVTTAGTESVDVSGRSRSFTQRQVYLDLEDPRLRIENVSSVHVAVIIEEERRPVELRVPIRVLPQDAAGQVSPRQADVVVSVPVSHPGELSGGGFYAYVLLDGGLTGEAIALPLGVFIPEEYREVARVESIQPGEVSVTPGGRR